MINPLDPTGPPAGSRAPAPRPPRARAIVLVIVLALVQLAAVPVLLAVLGGGDAPPYSAWPGPAGPAPISQVVFSPDGTLVASVDVSASSDASRVTVSDAATGKVLTTATDPHGVDAAAISPDDTTLAILDVDGTTYLRDITTGQLTAAMPAPGGGAVRGQTVAFRPDGKILAVADAGSTIDLWDPATRQVTATLAYTGSAGMVGLAFSPDGKKLAVFDSDDHVYLLDPATRSLAASLSYADMSGGPSAVAFSRDGSVLASCTGAHFSLWDIATGRKTAIQTPDGCRAVAFSSDGAVVATGDDNGVVYLRDAATGTTITRLTVPGGGRILAVAFSHGSQAITVGYLAGDTVSTGIRHWTLSPPARPQAA